MMGKGKKSLKSNKNAKIVGKLTKLSGVCPGKGFSLNNYELKPIDLSEGSKGLFPGNLVRISIIQRFYKLQSRIAPVLFVIWPDLFKEPTIGMKFAVYIYLKRIFALNRVSTPWTSGGFR